MAFFISAISSGPWFLDCSFWFFFSRVSMNFFEHQDIAYRNTKRLIILLCLAVISLIAVTTFFCATVLYYMEANSRHYLNNIGLWQGITQTMSW